MTSAEESVLRTTPHRRIADLWAFALTREGIPARVEPAGEAWAILAHVLDAERADEILAEIDAEPVITGEHVVPPPVPVVRTTVWWGRSWAGVTVAWLLLVFFAVTGVASPASPWFERGALDSRSLAQPWRVVTALTLHADLAHVLGNAAALAIFVTIVAWRFGPGGASFSVLAAATIANLVEALLARDNVVSIGASTAAFAALGLVAAVAIAEPARRRRAWVVLAASAALLALLGTSPGSDALAHFNGWLLGLVIGLPASFALRAPPSKFVQAALCACSIVVLAGAWIAASA